MKRIIVLVIIALLLAACSRNAGQSQVEQVPTPIEPQATEVVEVSTVEPTVQPTEAPLQDEENTGGQARSRVSPTQEPNPPIPTASSLPMATVTISMVVEYVSTDGTGDTEEILYEGNTKHLYHRDIYFGMEPGDCFERIGLERSENLPDGINPDITLSEGYCRIKSITFDIDQDAAVDLTWTWYAFSESGEGGISLGTRSMQLSNGTTEFEPYEWCQDEALSEGIHCVTNQKRLFVSLITTGEDSFDQSG